MTKANLAFGIAIVGITACAQVPVKEEVLASPHSWMDFHAAKRNLLYVSDTNGEVTVYRYGSEKLVGVLTDFKEPLGECVDANGDVFITDYARRRIDEYAHGGTKPIKILRDGPYQPSACSIDFSSGDLAVANAAGKASSQGNVAIYTRARGRPHLYTDRKLPNVDTCAYDDHGNLLAAGSSTSSDHATSFAWLSKGASKLSSITLPGPSSGWQWVNVRSVQWDGSYWAISRSDVYRISIVNGVARFIDTTSMSRGAGPYWIFRPNQKKRQRQLVGADIQESYAGAVGIWFYPAGGDEIGQILRGVNDPTGFTVSRGRDGSP